MGRRGGTDDRSDFSFADYLKIKVDVRKVGYDLWGEDIEMRKEADEEMARLALRTKSAEE